MMKRKLTHDAHSPFFYSLAVASFAMPAFAATEPRWFNAGDDLATSGRDVVAYFSLGNEDGVMGSDAQSKKAPFSILPMPRTSRPSKWIQINMRRALVGIVRSRCSKVTSPPVIPMRGPCTKVRFT